MVSLKAKFEMNSRWRAVIVLDKGLFHLAPLLKDKNFLTLELSEQLDLETMLLGRILITSDYRPYAEESAVYEFSMISLEQVKGLSPQKCVDLISEAFVTEAETLKEIGAVLILDENGMHKRVSYF